MRQRRLDWRRLAWGAVLLCAWSGVLFLFLRANGKLTAAELLKYEPENKLLAAGIMLVLFTLKSVDFLIHSGTLYAVSGIMFRPFAAVGLNLLGITVMAMIPYHAGKTLGASALDRIKEKYPKIRILEGLRERHRFLFVLLARIIGFPLAMTGVYMGAAGIKKRTYYLASLAGMFPTMLCFTLMGDSAGDFISPEFVTASLAYLLVTALAIGISFGMNRRDKKHLQQSKQRRREYHEQTQESPELLELPLRERVDD